MTPIEALVQRFKITVGEATKLTEGKVDSHIAIHKRPADLRTVLGHILELEHVTHVSYEDWRERFTALLGWDDIAVKSLSRTLTELEKKEYIIEWVRDRNRQLGWMLDKKGLQYLGLDVPKPVPQIVQPAKVDYASILEANADNYMFAADIGVKLKENREQRRKCMIQVAELDNQYAIMLTNVEQNLELLKILK